MTVQPSPARMDRIKRACASAGIGACIGLAALTQAARAADTDQAAPPAAGIAQSQPLPQTLPQAPAPVRQPERQKLVIVLSTHEPGIPDVATLIKGIREGLVDSRPTAFNIFVEHLDKSTPNGVDDKTLRQLFAQKYSSRDPDLLIALGRDAIDFAIRSRSQLWRGVPVIFAGEPRLVAQRLSAANVTGIAAAMETDRTLHTALQLFPETRRVALVNGSSSLEQEMRAEFIKDLGTYEGQIELIDLSGQPLERVQEALASLQGDAIAYFLSFRTDGTGRSFLGPEVLDVLGPTTSRPIFGTNSTYFGHGIVGGWLIDHGQLGREVAAQALRVLGGEPVAAIPLERSSSIRPMFDWRMLLRFKVSEERLPAGTILLFKEPTLWERYRSWIWTALVAFMLQGLLIAGLLLERAARKRAEAKALRLSSEVIMAAETERGRIAQELHDDVSQRLALLSIEIDQFGNKAGAVRPDAKAEVAALSGKTKEIADDIYQIARELHPAALKHLGLTAAARSFCGELQQRHGLPIVLNETDALRDIPDNVAVSLYRIIQEALQNTVKHSEASEATVTLARDAGDIVVTVADDGTGIPAGRNGAGTGIFGMRERLRLIGGSLRIHAAPGGGTIVQARAPANGS